MATDCSLKASGKKNSFPGGSREVDQRGCGIFICGGFPGLTRHGPSWLYFYWKVGLNDLQGSLSTSISEILRYVLWQYLE